MAAEITYSLYFVLMAVLFKGFSHEAPMNIIISQNSCLWPGIIDYGNAVADKTEY
jgi:hypothetical protein